MFSVFIEKLQYLVPTMRDEYLITSSLNDSSKLTRGRAVVCPGDNNLTWQIRLPL